LVLGRFQEMSTCQLIEDSDVKTYIALTAALFGLLAVIHVWRAIVEPSSRDPWFIAITVISALLCLWGSRLFLSVRGNSGTVTSD
jgi:dolichyl-phosphate-mannose--protein O-mannosyl transferase